MGEAGGGSLKCELQSTWSQHYNCHDLYRNENIVNKRVKPIFIYNYFTRCVRRSHTTDRFRLLFEKNRSVPVYMSTHR